MPGHETRKWGAMAENALTLLTLIGGPAVLTNACSLLAMNTANRYGRAFDRAREVGREVARAPAADPAAASSERIFERLVQRARLLLRAETAFFAGTGLFALSALVPLVGAALSQEVPAAWGSVVLVVTLVIGLLATGSVIGACVLMVRETRLAMVNLREEHWLLVGWAHDGADRAAAGTQAAARER